MDISLVLTILGVDGRLEVQLHGVCLVQSHMAQALKGPVLGLMLCWHHLEILKNVWPRGLVFSLFIGYHKLHGRCWVFVMVVKSSLFHFQSHEPCYSFPLPKRRDAVFFAQRCLQLPNLMPVRLRPHRGVTLSNHLSRNVGFFPLKLWIIGYQWSWPQKLQCLPNSYLLSNPFSECHIHIFSCLGYFQWGKLWAIESRHVWNWNSIIFPLKTALYFLY